VLRPGAVLGEMSMFDGEPRYASCWALSEVEAAVLDRAAVARLIGAAGHRRQAAGEAHAAAGPAPAQHQRAAGEGAAPAVA
jgi:CRP-like cAMP-binding protein